MFGKFLLCLVGLAVVLAVNAQDEDCPSYETNNPTDSIPPLTEPKNSKDPRIISQSADNEEVVVVRPRYHVDIVRLNEDESMQHLCDGAILQSRYVITAAHCVHDVDLAQLRIRSGSDVAPPTDMPHYEERLFHRVVKVMVPADFVPLPCRAHEHDVAIIKVNRAFDLAYDKLYKQVNLPEPTNDYEGYKTSLSVQVDNKLETFDAKVISNEECARNATSIITRGNVCAVVGDDFKIDGAVSGSPLVYENTLVGVMNAPFKCARTVAPETQSETKCVEQSANMKLYTRITAYLEFVNKVLNNLPSADIVYRS